MAKAEGNKYPYKSHYGSHSDMVDQDKTAALNDPALVVLNDEFGSYATERSRLDNNGADPNRYAEARLVSLFSNQKKEGEK